MILTKKSQFAQSINSATFFNIDNKKCFLSTNLAYYMCDITVLIMLKVHPKMLILSLLHQ